jgi:Cdc6-like AAA superfamily ATPase
MTGMADAIRRFIDDLTPAVQALGAAVPTIKAEKLAGDVALEAYELSGAMVDADGLHTDNELLAMIEVFGALLPTKIGSATPGELRATGLLSGKRHWVDAPSALFSLLLDADASQGTKHAWTYYERAMEVAHEVCGTDAHVSHLELSALERLRSTLLTPLQSRPLSTAPAAGAAKDESKPEPELPPVRPIEELYAELDALVGLAPVKAEIKLVADLLAVQKLRADRGLPVVETSRHLVFTGNPGTGKTTVARLLAQIYRTLGVVQKGHLVETDRAGLVAGYVGQTALKAQEVFDSALGGVLLIDEAYALARGGDNDFGQEAIDTLVKLIEDHRDEIAVIAAGYPEEMHEFIESNPGLRSRFPKTIHFPDYTGDELLSIFESQCKKASYTVGKDAAAAARSFFDAQPRDKGFGNGRIARNLFEAAMAAQASRLVQLKEPTNEQLCELPAGDIDAAAGVPSPSPSPAAGA